MAKKVAGQRVYVHENPKWWVYPWSVRASVEDKKYPKDKGSDYIVSQHRTKLNAEKAARRVETQDVRKLLGWKK